MTKLSAFIVMYLFLSIALVAQVGSGNDNIQLSCGSSLVINHVAGAVAPVTKTTTYGIVTGIPGEPTKCWITSNLGSNHQADSVNDASEHAAGWYWQFNLKQGYQHDGTTRTPASAWISSINENSDWIPANDPCAIELGTGWRLPTYIEWLNVDANTGGNWNTWNDAWNSGLKLHASGYLMYYDGGLYYRGAHGYIWSSTQFNSGGALYLDFYSTYCNMVGNGKSFGQSLRCLKEQTLPPAQILQNINIINGQNFCYNASQTITVAGSSTTFVVQNGGGATMIAGQKIQYLPGTTVKSGGHLSGYIAPVGPYCLTPSIPQVLTPVTEQIRIMDAAFFKVFPNPVKEKFALEFCGEPPVGEVTVKIYGLSGEIILSKVLNGERTCQFSLADQPAGVYFIRVISGKEAGTGKIFKQ